MRSVICARERSTDQTDSPTIDARGVPCIAFSELVCSRSVEASCTERPRSGMTAAEGPVAVITGAGSGIGALEPQIPVDGGVSGGSGQALPPSKLETDQGESP